MNMIDDVRDSIVPPGDLRLWWLAQAGFVFKTAGGQVVYLDPYLSDAVERLFGFKRLSLAPVAASDVRADLVLFSHEHADHLDPDAIPVIAANNPRCHFAGPACCTESLDQAGVSADRRTLMTAGGTYDLGGVTVHAFQADHGEMSPTALSMVMDFGGMRVLYSGDTALRPDLGAPAFALRPHIVLPCINGVFGNMDAASAAVYAELSGAGLIIPCHYWMFAEQGGDVGEFVRACSRTCSDAKVALLTPGQGYSYSTRDNHVAR